MLEEGNIWNQQNGQERLKREGWAKVIYCIAWCGGREMQGKPKGGGLQFAHEPPSDLVRASRPLFHGSVLHAPCTCSSKAWLTPGRVGRSCNHFVSMRPHESGPSTEMSVEMVQSGPPDRTPPGCPVRRLVWHRLEIVADRPGMPCPSALLRLHQGCSGQGWHSITPEGASSAALPGGLHQALTSANSDPPKRD